MASQRIIASVVWLVGCNPDWDGDGWAGDEDCAPEDGSVFAWAPEQCNGRDDDCDGDGSDDLLVGAPCQTGGSSPPGFTYVFRGPFSGDFDLADAHATLQGAGDGAEAGTAVDGGDVDGDGFLDIVVGAPLDGEAAAGSIAIVPGPVAGEHVLGAAGLYVEGEVDDDRLGCSVAVLGDVSGDGLADVLAGAFLHDGAGEDAGAVYLFLGPATTARLGLRLDGEADGDRAGQQVAAPGDLNGDGLADLLVGAEEASPGGADSGGAYVVFGPVTVSGSLGDADAVLVGEVGDEVGRVVAGAGDVDADGRLDLLVSGDSEVAHLVLGPVTGLVALTTAAATLDGVQPLPGSLLGEDLDGDGHSDVLACIADPISDDEPPPVAWWVPGPVEGALAPGDAGRWFRMRSDDNPFWFTAAVIGDADGDMEFALANPLERHDDEATGVVYVFDAAILDVEY